MATHRQFVSPSVGRGTFTVLDLMLLVAASTLSLLFMRALIPSEGGWAARVAVISFCSPAGVAVLGPWVVRRQFTERIRDELYVGEWLWLALAGGWGTVLPLSWLVTMPNLFMFVAGWIVAIGCAAVVAIALGQSIASRHRYPWTHWVGITLCLFETGPILVLLVP